MARPTTAPAQMKPTGPLTRSSVPTVPNFSDDAAMPSNRWSLLLSIRDIALLSQWQVSQRCPFGADDRVRKDTVSKKIGQSRGGALLLHLCGLYIADWLGRGAPYCHDRLLMQHLSDQDIRVIARDPSYFPPRVAEIYTRLGCH